MFPHSMVLAKECRAAPVGQLFGKLRAVHSLTGPRSSSRSLTTKVPMFAMKHTPYPLNWVQGCHDGDLDAH